MKGMEEGGGEEDLSLDVGVGAVLTHVIVELSLVGIAPLFPLTLRQEDRVSEESDGEEGREREAKRRTTVRGMVGSLIVLTTSTNGTSATAALKSSGYMLIVAPISSPPVRRRRRTRRRGERGTCTPPNNGKMFRGSDVPADQLESTIFEIKKSVHLAKILPAMFVPLVSTHLPTPTNMSDGIDHTSVQERQASVVKGGINTGAIGTIAVKEHRSIHWET
jgi:hypothetical protein